MQIFFLVVWRLLGVIFLTWDRTSLRSILRIFCAIAGWTVASLIGFAVALSGFINLILIPSLTGFLILYGHLGQDELEWVHSRHAIALTLHLEIGTNQTCLSRSDFFKYGWGAINAARIDVVQRHHFDCLIDWAVVLAVLGFAEKTCHRLNQQLLIASGELDGALIQLW